MGRCTCYAFVGFKTVCPHLLKIFSGYKIQLKEAGIYLTYTYFKFRTQFQYNLRQLETNEGASEVNVPEFIVNDNFEMVKKEKIFMEKLKIKRTAFELMNIK